MKKNKPFARLEKIKNELSADYPKEVIDNIIADAEILLSHKLNIFEITKDFFGKKIKWNNDPVLNRSWHIFRKKPILLSWKKNKDIKYVWELNRQQHLCLLGQAYLFTKDDRYSREIIFQITDWIDSNAFGKTINWMSPLEISLRLISWIWALSYILDSREINDEIEEKIKSSIYMQTKFIASNLQTREFPNNHLIGELAGMAIIGMVFPGFKESSEWLDKGLSMLVEQIQKQVYPDGINKEHAWDYHRFVLDFYTQVVIISKKLKKKIPQSLLDRLEKMYEALMFSVRPDGVGPMTGDDDNGRVVKLSMESGRNFLFALSTGAVLFNRPDMKYIAKKFHEESLWLLGTDGYDEFNRLEERPPEVTSMEFKEAGQYIMRSGWDKDGLYMNFDCGEQGMGQAGHGHADALSFELFAYGKSLLIDPGTYTYNGPKEWRNYFRGTSAHNTVVINGIDQAGHLKPYDAFGWEKKADAYVLKWHNSLIYDFASAYHDGYTRLPQPVRHQRDILFIRPEYWIITDTISGQGKHLVDFLFHFSPGRISLDKSKKTVKSEYDHGANILLAPVCGTAFKTEIIEGQESPIQGWASYSYGKRQKAPVVKYSMNTRMPLCFSTIIFPFRSEAPKFRIQLLNIADEENLLSGRPCAGFRIAFDSYDDYYIKSDGYGGIKKIDVFSTDSRMIFMRVKNSKEISKLIMINGSFIQQNDVKLISAKGNVCFLDMEADNNQARVSFKCDSALSIYSAGFDKITINGLAINTENRDHLKINE